MQSILGGFSSTWRHKTPLQKEDSGPSVRAKVNMPLMTAEATQRQAIVQEAHYYLLLTGVHQDSTSLKILLTETLGARKGEDVRQADALTGTETQNPPVSLQGPFLKIEELESWHNFRSVNNTKHVFTRDC